MLLIAKSLKDLDFRQLMNVYEEGNLENARESFSQLPLGQAVLEAEQDFYGYLKDSFFATPGAFYGIWTEDRKYVSALRLEPYRDGWLVEAVETAPSQRRKGYAAVLMAQVLTYLGQGKVYSHVHKANTASLGLHRRCGFCRICDRAVYIDGSVNNRCATYFLDMGDSVCQNN